MGNMERKTPVRTNGQQIKALEALIAKRKKVIDSRLAKVKNMQVRNAKRQAKLTVLRRAK